MTILKAELEQENERLRDQIDRLNDKDKRLRIEFAKAFDWVVKRAEWQSYIDSPTYREVTWDEIFVQIGRMLDANDKRILLERIEMIEGMAQSLQRKLVEHLSDDVPEENTYEQEGCC